MSTTTEHLNASSDVDEELTRQKENIENLSEISKNSRTTFIAILLAVAYSYITIGATTDAALFSNSTSSPLPIIQAQVPIVWFYYFTPIILFLLFVYFHVYLQRFWRCVAVLPLVHKDGRTLDEYIYPWIISTAFLRAEIPDLNTEKKFRLPFEAVISIFMAWWLIPIILIFFWARYLTLNHWPGTIEHIIILMLSVAGAIRFYFAAKEAVNSKREVRKSSYILLHINALTIYGALLSLIVLIFISFGAIEGAPAEDCNSKLKVNKPVSECGLLYSGGRLLQKIGYSPYAYIEGKEFQKPDNWWELVNDEKFTERLKELPRPYFINKDLNFANARNAFLMRSNFTNASMRWIKLKKAILINANLTNADIFNGNLEDADLRLAVLTNAKLQNTNFKDANLQSSYITGAQFIESSLEKANLKNASGIRINFYKTKLNDSDLTSVQFSRSKMEGVKLEDSELTNANISLTKFDCVRLNGATMVGAELTHSIFKETDLMYANLSNAILDNVDFINSDLEQAIMKSAFARNSKFENVKLIKSDLSGSDFRKARFTNTDFSNASFNNADFVKATFNNSVFRDADFGKADLHYTVFKNSDLSGAILTDTKGFELAKFENSCGNKQTLLPKGHTLPACKGQGKLKAVDVFQACIKYYE